MKRFSKWTVEALLLSDDLAKLIEANRIAENGHSPANNVDRQSAEERKATVPQVTASQPTSKLDVGSYTVTCTGVVESVMDNTKFDNPEIYRFYFDVEGMLDENGEQATTDAICSRRLSPKSKLWKFLTAFGMHPEIGKTFELEDCIGKTVMAVVEPNEAGTYNNVASLVPLPKGPRANAPANDDVPFDAEPPAESSPLNDWLTAMRGVGFSTKEIIDLCKSRFEKLPKDLTDLQRGLLSMEYGI